MYKLHKAFYGLKHAPRASFNRLKGYCVDEGLGKRKNEWIRFLKHITKSDILNVSIYVDSLFFIGNDESLLVKFKNSMKGEYDVTNVGKMRYFLDIEVIQHEHGVYCSQRKYDMEIIERLGWSVQTPIVSGNKIRKIQKEKR